MKYTLSYQIPSSHYIDVAFTFSNYQQEKIKIQLPAWRPGRYELGNFAKNVQKIAAVNEKGQSLNLLKITKDAWEVSCKDATEITIRYNYFANELNAGSTFLDSSQLYVNPVNCLLYLPDFQQEACELELEIPANYQVAGALNEMSKNHFRFSNFDELADTPFIASANLKHHDFMVAETKFHLWFQGECKPDFEKLENDFAAYTKAQIDLFGDFPCKEYHYLFQILPFKAYHGVEHANSTVLLLGPSYEIMQKGKMYEELLGVCCHELFHTWNIKRIRPIEMFPYDFSKENYSRLGYLAEGATTWYGDEMLYRSGVFDESAYAATLIQLLDRHYNNPGSSTMSVADSSFDTWLDGYVPGVPNRKASIYTEGALVTLMLDVIIKKGSEGKHSFDDVMKCFYQEYYKKGKGISEADYKSVVERFAKQPLDEFFAAFVNGAEDMTELLQASFDFIGFDFEKLPSSNFHEAYLGFRLLEGKVYSIFPDSPAELAGLSVGDSILTINHNQVKDNLAEWCMYFKNEEIKLLAITAQGIQRTLKMRAGEDFYYARFTVNKKS